MLSTTNTGLSVTWANLRVLAEQKKENVFKKTTISYKEIIRNVDGAVKAGTLVAILGASGSGKTTLMSVLANRSPGGLHVSGSIKIGGKSMGGLIRYVSGFVYQDDLLIPILTVFEHLNFTAKLRLDRNMNDEARKHLIFEILTELGLLEVANSPIGISKFGNEKVNLSGGERKRLSIASELLTDPSLLFCDEPTTGLDSFTALKVVENLDALVRDKQKTIICSVHQPNEKIFALFNQIILMSDGKIVFSGNSIDALEFFKNQGYTYTEGQNQAEYLIKSLADTAEGADRLWSTFQDTEIHGIMMKYIETENENGSSQTQDPISFQRAKFNGPSWFSKLRYLTHRNLLVFIRDRSIIKTHLIEKLVVGLIIGLCLRGSVTFTQKGLQAFQGVIFMLVSHNYFPAVRMAMHAIPKQLPFFIREYTNSANTPLLFYLSNILSLLPGNLIDPLLFTIVIYWLTNLSPSIFASLMTCLVVTLMFNISSSFGIFMSIVFANGNVAAACSDPIAQMFFTCSGVFIKLRTIPIYLKWVIGISWFAHAMEALYIIHFQNVHYIECPKNSQTPCLNDGSEVLASLGFDAQNLWFNVTIMVFTYFFINSMSFIGLLRRIRT